MPLPVKHIHPKAVGGSNRVSNLALACGPCSSKKGAHDVKAFLSKDLVRLAKILAQVKRLLKDAGVVNATGCALVGALKAAGMPIKVASGRRTKFNRTQLGIPKTYALGAVCVGEVSAVTGRRQSTLKIKCFGRCNYQRTQLKKYGSPRVFLMRTKRVNGFGT